MAVVVGSLLLFDYEGMDYIVGQSLSLSSSIIKHPLLLSLSCHYFLCFIILLQIQPITFGHILVQGS